MPQGLFFCNSCSFYVILGYMTITLYTAFDSGDQSFCSFKGIKQLMRRTKIMLIGIHRKGKLKRGKQKKINFSHFFVCVQTKKWSHFLLETREMRHRFSFTWNKTDGLFLHATHRRVTSIWRSMINSHILNNLTSTMYIISPSSLVILFFYFEVGADGPSRTWGRICRIPGCAGLGQPMRWQNDNTRIDEGRYVC